VTVDRLFDFIASELSQSRQEPIRLGVGRSLTLLQYPPKKTTVVVDETCPYQGLQAFGKEQARFFFGREKVVQLLLDKLGQANFVPIIGASGSGKSSVVRAGLIPQLEKNGWRVLEPILPGDEPFAELKTVLIELFGRTEGREVYSLVKTEGLRPVIERLSGSERLLLLVDQFEEVFTLCPKEEERRQFIELLTQVNEIPDLRLAIVTTMRADFLEPCLSYDSLTRLIQNEAVYMPPLVGAELEEAIATPAKLQGYSFGDGLLGAILHDVGQEKECLPLLQFALTELWEKRDREHHQLTVEQYQTLGGVTGTLNDRANKIYRYKDFLKDSPQQERSPQEQEWIKRIFLKLVRTGEGIKDTRQRQLKAKLLAMGSDRVGGKQASPPPGELSPSRLLVTGQENRLIAVRADPAKLKQVLLNVVSNAVKFTDSGSITINTRIEPIPKTPPLISPNKEEPGEMLVRTEGKEESVPLARTNDGDWSSSSMTLSDSCLATLPYRVVVTVKDTGIGIDPDQRHKLFHPFVRVDASTTRKVSGMGLGLTISANLMKLMGGSINLYSEGNSRGTTVEISLPMIEPSQLYEKLET
jgi:hypothetical protein